MTMRQKVLLVFGTRPEAIKMVPVVAALRRRSAEFDLRICVTAQHRQMLDQVLALFDIRPDYDLDLMRPGQELGDLTGRILSEVRPVLREFKPDRILVHGDTTTSFAAGLAAFYERIPVGHVEAGLRTGDLLSPYPEELNRRITGVIADLHFAPTLRARANLLAEGVPEERIYVTGNTGIDSLFAVLRIIEARPELRAGIDACLGGLRPDRKLIVVTGHRRENFGARFDSLCEALADVAQDHPDAQIVYPVHANPNVREPVQRILGDLPADRVLLTEPLDYLPFVYLMSRAHLILTDSGGVQEEAPSLRKPILVLRDTTERPEVIEAGCAKLVGTDRETIRREVSALMSDPALYIRMASGQNPFGQGDAGERIANWLDTRRIAITHPVEQLTVAQSIVTSRSGAAAAGTSYH